MFLTVCEQVGPWHVGALRTTVGAYAALPVMAQSPVAEMSDPAYRLFLVAVQHQSLAIGLGSWWRLRALFRDRS
jgi:hypothetical protein